MVVQKKYHITKDGHKIVYNYLKGEQEFLVFLGGLMSDMEGTKAVFFEEYCKRKGYSYIRFDYLGHGESDLEFTDCTIDTWLNNVIEMLTIVVNEKVTLIGSSLGGWLMCLAAQRFSDQIKNLIGIAPAPDFTEYLIWDNLSESGKEELVNNNIYNLPSCDEEGKPYPITMDLVKSGRKYLLLDSKSKLNINIPVRLFHGMQDEDVPYEYSIKLANQLSSTDVEVKLIKDGDHRLSDDKILKSIACDLDRMSNPS